MSTVLKDKQKPFRICTICQHKAHSECVTLMQFQSKKKREKRYICAYCDINENGDRTPFYASQEFDKVPSDTNAQTLTLSNLGMRNKKKMGFDWLITRLKKKQTRGGMCLPVNESKALKTEIFFQGDTLLTENEYIGRFKKLNKPFEHQVKIACSQNMLCNGFDIKINK